MYLAQNLEQDLSVDAAASLRQCRETKCCSQSRLDLFHLRGCRVVLVDHLFRHGTQNCIAFVLQQRSVRGNVEGVAIENTESGSLRAVGVDIK